MTRTSIFGYAGGAPAFRALAADFHQRCVADPELSHPFARDLNPRHVDHLAEYWGEVLGGPPHYSTRRIGHSGMLDIHARNGMQPSLIAAFVRCFDEAVAAQLPPDPELRATLHDYMVWATAEVMRYDAADSVVPAGLPTPRWDWSGPVA